LQAICLFVILNENDTNKRKKEAINISPA